MNWGFPNVKQFNNFVPSQFTVSVDRGILNENLALLYSMSRITRHFVSSLHFIFVSSIREIKPHWGRPPSENSMRKPQCSSTVEVPNSQDFEPLSSQQVPAVISMLGLLWLGGEIMMSCAWRHKYTPSYLQTPGLFQHPHTAEQMLW